MTKTGLRLQRILYAQAHRFPELGDTAFQKAAAPLIAVLSNLFRHHAALGEISVTDPERTAVAFMGAVVGGPARKAMRGTGLSASEIEDHVRFAIDLFFNGIAAR